MITFKANERLFYANSQDIANGDHLPDVNGCVTENKIKLQNGDVLLNIESMDIYFYDKELKVWNMA